MSYKICSPKFIFDNISYIKEKIKKIITEFFVSESVSYNQKSINNDIKFIEFSEFSRKGIPNNVFEDLEWNFIGDNKVKYQK
tara:strand:+ start:595 stop:840 length:246 start_codon:yes stop_codon:yes gene_type:complete